jgi:MFS family permease
MTKPNKEKKALNPVVVKLGFVSFFADVASEMLYPITPIFLTAVLGASMTSVGFIEGFAEAVASLLKTYSGSWSDKIQKRKPFVVIGYFLGAIGKPMIGVAGSWVQVLFARGIDRTGKGLRSAPRDALIAESVDKSQIGAAYGWHRGMDTLGAAVGPLLTLFLLGVYQIEMRQLYFWALIPGIISVLIVMSLKENRLINEDQKMQSSTKSVWHFSLKPFDSRFKNYLSAWGVFSLVNSSDVFLLMKAKAMGLSTSEIILLYCGYNLLYALSSPVLGRWSDRFSKWNFLSSGLLLFSFVYLGFAWATQAWQLALLFCLYGIYMAATDGIGKALLIELVPKELKATGLGMMGTITGVATILASTMAGLLWDHWGTSAPFIYGAGGALIAAVIFWNLKKTQFLNS